MGRVVLGIERIEKELSRLVRGRRTGLLAHPASVDSNLSHSLDILKRAGAKVEALFGPEHGFGGEVQDMEPANGASTGPGGIPLYSLYQTDEKSLSPDVEALKELDLLVVDLFDVGARYYTFVWTAVLCLRACHKAGVDLLLADRPNPLGGVAVEGAPQLPGFLSFVGLIPVANRHGLTQGELVSLASELDGTFEALTVAEMTGWNRSMLFPETKLPWVMPSPNMPTFDTALVYPGLCLIEATWASEGRGTTRPFELVGAPGLNSGRICSTLEEMALPGVKFRPCSFKPGFQKHAGVVCFGVQIHVVDPARFLPYRTGIAVLLALKAEAKDRFEWRSSPYEFVSDRPAIDLLTGSSAVRDAVDQGAALDEIAAGWADREDAFRLDRERFFRYR